MARQLKTVSEKLGEITKRETNREKIRQGILTDPYPGVGSQMHVQLTDPTYGDNLALKADVMAGLITGALPKGTGVTVRVRRGRLEVVGVGGGFSGIASAIASGSLGSSPTFLQASGDMVDVVIDDVLLRWNWGGVTHNNVIHGISNGSEGRVVIIENVSGGDLLTLADDSAVEPNAQARIYCPHNGRILIWSGASVLLIYDGTTQRWIPVSTDDTQFGGSPYVYPDGISSSSVQSATAALAVPAAGLSGGRAIPFWISAAIYLQRFALWTTDTTLARSFEFNIYYDQIGSLNSSFKQLISGEGYGSRGWTATAAGWQIANCLGAPLWLKPGLYWVIFRNTHATNTLGISLVNPGTAAANMIRGANTALVPALGAFGVGIDPIDISAWPAITNMVICRLEGRIGAEAAVF